MIMEQALDYKTAGHIKWSGKRAPGGCLELMQQRINDERYLNAAIQRLALVLSKELMEITREGMRHERQRKRRK